MTTTTTRRRRRAYQQIASHPADDGYARAGGEAAFCLQQPAAGRGEGEGNVNGGGNNEHINGCVWGPSRADTGDGRQWRSRRDGDNNDDVVEGGSHPTPLTTVTHGLEARLRSAGILYAPEASLSDVDDANRRRQ